MSVSSQNDQANIPVLTDIVTLGALVPPGTEAAPPILSDQAKCDDPEEATQTAFVLDSEEGSTDFLLGTAASDSEDPTVFLLEEVETTLDGSEITQEMETIQANSETDPSQIDDLVNQALPLIMPELEKLVRKTLEDIIQNTPSEKSAE